MTTFEKRVQVNFSQEQMYNLVADVAAYPEFLPWCRQVDIQGSEPDHKLVRIGMRFQQLPEISLTTRAAFHPPASLQLRLIAGSFLSQFEGDWFFEARGEKSCMVTFIAKYHFANGLLGLSLAPFFRLMVTMLPERFIRRAEEIYP
ncbi:type II toxin-antitoxin system RatA family toxin [Kalamiella sp. sgz302252]|uniref:type II toxin-antitoxin system RatA family toxin n=1 Tax=Pantoea sp. sgz302252 TaxID=3341827 RepID=UPI0036D3606A